jgi:molybdopterin molybdotransferase
MISVDEALKIVLDSVRPLESETVELKHCYGRVLTEDIYSDCDIPAFDYSAMDGYAVRHLNTKGASSDSPVYLRLIGEIRAGGEFSGMVGNGEAVKIMTGAPIPDGADAVIMVEYTRTEGERVAVLQGVEEGENIRRAGEDIREGDLVIKKGTRLNPAHAGMLAALGRNVVNVRRRPRIAILVTGDEVIMPDEEIVPGKVRNANAFSLCGQIIKAGAIPVDMGIARDRLDDLRIRLSACLDHDVIVTSGGVSMGEYDLVRDVLLELGLKQGFYKVAMRPGKPNLFGIIDNKPVFGLPGNPVSCMIGFEVFVRPAILRMLGQDEDDMVEVDAYLEEDVKKKKGLMFFIRAQTRWEDGRYVTKTTGPQGSGMLSSMVLANSLMILPEEDELIKKGTMVRVRFL